MERSNSAVNKIPSTQAFGITQLGSNLLYRATYILDRKRSTKYAKIFITGKKATYIFAASL